MPLIESLTDNDNEKYDALLESCCALLAPLVQGIPDGALATIQGVYACHPRAPDFLLAACAGLRGRYDEGESVHLRYLPSDLLDLIRRAEHMEKREDKRDEAAEDLLPDGSSRKQRDEDQAWRDEQQAKMDREAAEQEARAKADPMIPREKSIVEEWADEDAEKAQNAQRLEVEEEADGD